MSRPGVSGVWATAALADTIGQFGVKTRMYLARGETVLCDRYVADAMMDLRLWFPELPLGSSAIEAAVRAVSPTPDLSFLMMLPWEEVLARSAKKAEPYPDPPEVRRRRYDAYHALLHEGAHSVIDAAQSPEDVHEGVVARVFEVRKRGR